MANKHYLLQIDRVDDNIDINHDRTDKVSLSVIEVIQCALQAGTIRRTYITHQR